MRRVIVSLLFSALIVSAKGQLICDPEIQENLKEKIWPASWISSSEVSAHEYAVLFFRNNFQLEEVPDEYIIHVSADNRYRLYINNEWIGLGPARSDAQNWNYDSYDISSYLKPGENTIAAEVWNYGELRPHAQMSVQTGFIVQENEILRTTLNTPGSWECINADCYSSFRQGISELNTYFVAGPGIKIDGRSFPWGWKKNKDDAHWQQAVIEELGIPKGVGGEIHHGLVSRKIPAMELKSIESPMIRTIDNKIPNSTNSSISGQLIEANTKQIFILDNRELTCAYPEIIVSGGEDAKITLSYAESLFTKDGGKEQRDSVVDMVFKGYSDRFISEGGNQRSFSSLWFRTFRYIQLEVETGNSPLRIESLNSTFSAYPFTEKAYFKSDQGFIDDIWDISWRTSRLCANETYFDCPYYEQLQYVGDTRIQALISLYVSGDDRLMKKAIEDIYHSINSEGLTQSRYPSKVPQIIPTYSLSWIGMIHDYLQHRNDYMFAAQYLTSIQHILQWFENRIDEESGLLGKIEYWPFVDWTREWKWDNERLIGGVPPGGKEGNSSIISLQYVLALQEAEDIFNFYGLKSLADSYNLTANEIIAATKKTCWNEEKGYLSDTPKMTSFSQHANALGVLSGAIDKNDAPLLMERVIRDTSLVQSSSYFQYYLNRAAIQSGLGNKYLQYLGTWKEMISTGLTTCVEQSSMEETRSDCHAWSSSPLYEFLSTVAGIKPADVGFRTVIIQPHPGDLKHIEALVPHHKGDIVIDLKFDKKGNVKGSVELPESLKGIFVWDQQTLDLHAGAQSINMKPLSTKFKIK